MAKVHLVLGAGGARGMAHIGVIEELEREGHEIIEVIGCSMGAVVGGMYCSGYLPQYSDWLLTLTKSSVWRLLDFTFTRQGFLKGERIFDTILDMTGPQKIEDLPIPLTVVATEMLKRQEVIIREGDLFQALRASISIPGIFTPVKNDHSIMVDGGVLNPLPLNLVKKQKDAIVVAVNINSLEDTNPELSSPIEKPIPPPDSASPLQEWFPIQWPFTRNNGNALPAFSLLELLQTSYHYTQDRLTQMMLEFYPPDILVDIARTTCSTFEFYRAAEVIELGRKTYKQALRSIEK